MSNELTAAELAVCHATGITPADFIAARGQRNHAQPTFGLCNTELAVCFATGIAPSDYAATKRGAAYPESCASASGNIALAACAFSVTAPREGASRIEIQLTPAGTFKPSDGREMKVPAWRIDRAIADKVIARFNARKTPPVVDYEHQTLHKETNGQPAPAAAWMRALEWREGSGLWATVELTERAAELIRAGEYRFVSPVFAYDAATGEVLAVHMAAFTNAPAIDGMEPLAVQAAATLLFNR